MPSAPRWRKLAGDLAAERGRLALMVAAIGVSLVGVGAVLGAYARLAPAMDASYLGTRPASATLEIPTGVDAALVAAVRGHPAVAEAEARAVITARARVGDEWRRMLLFVVDDFDALRLNIFRPETGAWPPPDGTLLLERSAVAMVAARPGDPLVVKTPRGAATRVRVSGLVHDPGLAPAWQERSGYGYVTRATIAALGESPLLDELRIELRGRPLDPRVIEARAAAVSAWLGARGHAVRAIRVPPPAQHPHGRQMTTVLALLGIFAGCALVLSAILVATSLAALLARQVREIGVMKTLGARAGQIAALYAVLVGLAGLAAVIVALPLGLLGGRLFAVAVARMLNFSLGAGGTPAWVVAAVAAAGIGVPLLVAALPIRRASRITVRAALDDHGTGAGWLPARLAALPAPVRGALRRPARLALTLGLLAAGGAMCMTAVNVKRGWEANVAQLYATRSYDVEVLLGAAAPVALAAELARRPGVRAVEAWGYSPAAFARPGAIDVVRTYPDRGHGSLVVMGPPPGTGLVRLPLTAGRWLAPGDRDAVVLNHVAHAQSPGTRVGDRVTLSLDGAPASLRVVGIVQEIGAPGVAYVTDAAFAAATGTAGRARLLRIATTARTPAARAAAIRDLEEALAAAGVGVEAVIPLAELRTAVGDHILILIRALLALAAILAVVGALGLGSAMSVAVVERTREIGVLKTLGATPARVVRLVVGEGLVVALASFVLAALVSVPLTLLVDALVGSLGFLAPLPLSLSPLAALAWLALVITVAAAATLVPARRAARLGIREALARV